MATIDTLPAAYQRAAREILFPKGYGSPVARVSIDVIERDSSFREAADENARRHIACWTWVYHETGQLYGFGQMARDYERALKQSQLYPNQFSHPDRSWHVIDFTPRLLEPTACDNVGIGRGGSPPDGFAAIRAHCSKFGLRTVSAPNERHHTQFAEFPGTKADYNADPSKYAMKTWSSWPRLPERFYVGSGHVTPPPTNVNWDPATHNYWLFPANVNKPVLRQNADDADPIGHVLYAQYAVRVAAYLQMKSGNREFARVLDALGNPDGNFGPRTHLAVTIYQQLRGLNADGIIGPKTWADLDAHIQLAQAGA